MAEAERFEDEDAGFSYVMPKDTGFDWGKIKAAIEAEPWLPTEDNGHNDPEHDWQRQIFLGTVFGIMPSGKFYTFWASGNVCEAEADADHAYWELMEAEAEAAGYYVTNGEGDPCDIFVGEHKNGLEVGDHYSLDWGSHYHIYGEVEPVSEVAP